MSTRYSIADVLVRRDGFTEEEAKKEVVAGRKELLRMIATGKGFDAYDFCADRWGLEPDYLDELIY